MTLAVDGGSNFPSNRMRRIVRVAAFIALILAGVAGWCVYQGVSASVHAEYVLHAALLTVQLLEEYVVQHDGAWPRSWSDLETIPPRERGLFDWPKDSREVQRYVEIDFSANPERLAKQGIEGFDAVRPIGPYYGFKDSHEVKALLKALRERKVKGR